MASVNSGLGSEGALDLDRKVGKGQDSVEYGEVCVGGGGILKDFKRGPERGKSPLCNIQISKFCQCLDTLVQFIFLS